MTTAVTAYPPRLSTGAILGFNADFTNPTIASAVLAAGGTMARAHVTAWGDVEDYATGALAFSASVEVGLAWCGAHGLQPVLIAGYGPPHATIATLTVAGPVAAGSYVIPVTGLLGSIVPQNGYVLGAANAFITSKRAHYGGIIDKVDMAGRTIVLGSATTTPLSIGQTLTVQQLRYPSLADVSPSNPGVTAFIRYVAFTAARMATNGCTGLICIWNEQPWDDDPWDNRNRFYDSPPAGMNGSDGLRGILTATLGMTLPDGIRLVNGATDKTGFSSALPVMPPLSYESQNLVTSPAQITNVLSGEGIHPYADDPEGHAWDPSTVGDYGWYQEINPVEIGSNFRAMALNHDLYGASNGGVRPRIIATECGSELASDDRQAVYLLRRVLSLWGMDVPVLVFGLGCGGNLDVLRSIAPMMPRASYTCLQNLMALVRRLPPGVVGWTGEAPTVVGWVGLDNALMTTSLVGAPGHSLVFLWARTMAGSWATIPTPSVQPCSISSPPGSHVAEILDLRTNAWVPYMTNGQTLAIPVGENPVGIRFAP